MKQEHWIRITGVILSISLLVFMIYAVYYWANFPLQEVIENTGGVFFWTGLILILLFRVNSFLIDTTNMIFSPKMFIKNEVELKPNSKWRKK